MPRSRRGGPRVGQVGASYTNRSDLQSGPRVLAPSAAPNQTYGKAGEQLASQRVVPMGSPPPPAVAAGAGAGSAAPAPAFNPGQGPDLLRPTEFPDQPLTHGSPSGPGPGPEALSGYSAPANADVNLQLRALYSRTPNEDLRELLEDIDAGRSF